MPKQAEDRTKPPPGITIWQDGSPNRYAWGSAFAFTSDTEAIARAWEHHDAIVAAAAAEVMSTKPGKGPKAPDDKG